MLEIAGVQFRSRLLVGTGKYRNNEEMVRAIEASGAEVVTVAVRRVNLDRGDEAGILHHLDADQYFPAAEHRRAATRPTKRSATPAWRARRDSTTGSSWR